MLFKVGTLPGSLGEPHLPKEGFRPQQTVELQVPIQTRDAPLGVRWGFTGRLWIPVFSIYKILAMLLFMK